MLTFADIEKQFAAIDYNTPEFIALFPIELDEERELHLFTTNAGYKAEIWDNSRDSFIAETIASAAVWGTGCPSDDICYCLELCFEDLTA